jgi:hypothetical protein
MSRGCHLFSFHLFSFPADVGAVDRRHEIVAVVVDLEAIHIVASKRPQERGFVPVLPDERPDVGRRPWRLQRKKRADRRRNRAGRGGQIATATEQKKWEKDGYHTDVTLSASGFPLSPKFRAVPVFRSLYQLPVFRSRRNSEPSRFSAPVASDAGAVPVFRSSQ